MAMSSFRKGAVVGAASVLVIGGLVVVALIVAWMITAGDEPPEPTATRHEAAGTVTATEPRLCVEDPSDHADDAESTVWCGLTSQGMTPGVSVGDSVVGSLIEVELDPGSGAAWTFWETLTPASG